MSLFAAAFLYPVLLAVLTLGVGLLIERACGVALPVLVLPALGFGGLVVASQFTVLVPVVAPFTPEILAILAIAGFVLSRDTLRARWSGRDPRWWVRGLPGVATYLVVGLPLLAAGRLTFPGYLLDTTAGFHLAAGEWMLHHGAPLPSPYHAYGAMLVSYYGNGYPSGGQVLLAASGWLSGQDLLWLWFPFQVFAVSASALVLTYLAEVARVPRWGAAVAGWIAAASALVAAYAMMGSIKELTALPLLLTMGALAATAPLLVRGGLRGVLPFAVAAAGAIGAIGLSAGAWIVALGAVGIALSLPGLRPLAGRIRASGALGHLATGALAAGLVAAAMIVLTIPTITRLAPSLHTALGLSGSNASLAADPGNLARPLRFVQAFGIWLGETHRLDPRYLNETYVLIGVAMVCVVLGALRLMRRPALPLLAVIAASMVVWAALDRRGTEWTSAKVMMLTSPLLVLTAMIGALGDRPFRRLQATVLAAALAGGVLASAALLYHGTAMAPTARFQELRSIGERFADQGPTLLPDFDEYTLYLLRKLRVDAPGFAGGMHRPFVLWSGGPQYGHSYDVDDFASSSVQQFRLIVARRSPRWSRPPGNFALVWQGHYYDVWRRTTGPPRLHIPSGSGLHPVATLPCRVLAHEHAVGAIRAGDQLRYASRISDVVGNLSSAERSPNVALLADLDGLPQLTFNGPGGADVRVTVHRAGHYGLWLGAAVDRPLRVLVDGHEVGAPSHQSGGDGNMIRVGPVDLSQGVHHVEMARPGGGLSPGDNSGTAIDALYLELAPPERETVQTLNGRSWHSLCGRPVDWVEVT